MSNVKGQRSKVRHRGFTLVELMVSLTITSILMLGMSVFFSSTFHQLFLAQKQADTTQRQFAVNEIIRTKFAGIEAIIKPRPASKDWILIKNKAENKQLPFSYIGLNSDQKLVFKDLLPFNKMAVYHQEHIFANSGLGNLRGVNPSGGEGAPLQNNPSVTADFKNLSSFLFLNSYLYVALPDENQVLQCKCERNTCAPRQDCRPVENLPPLNRPTDLAGKDDEFYISNRGSGEVILYNAREKKGVALPHAFKMPTGLAYYENKDDRFLFVASTMEHQVKKVDLTSFDRDKKTIDVSVFVGGGEDSTCHHRTAGFCKLNLPTGLFADESNHSLFIADSGNNRILRVKDPSKPENILFEFSPEGHFALDRIDIENPEWIGGGNYIKNESNLIGDWRNFSQKDKSFKNPNEMTVFVNAKCRSSRREVYVNEEITSWDLQRGMKVVAVGKNMTKGSEVLNIDNPPTKTSGCGDKQNPVDKWELTLTGDEIDRLENGDSIYLANPDPVKIKLEKIQLDPKAKGGFKSFVIKVYDKFQGLVNTSYHVERVGDGILGTEEDVVTVMTQKEPTPQPDIVVNREISFPTGLTFIGPTPMGPDIYFVNAGEEKVRQIQNPNMSNRVSSLTTDNLTGFDYTSDFKIKEKGLTFNEYNNILELKIQAVIDENKTQEYKINAVLPANQP